MAALVNLPVVLRIGEVEAEIGTIEISVGGMGWATGTRKTIADMLRAAADAYEHPSPDEEVPDAAPR